MAERSTPHDHFFKRVFGEPANTRDLLENYLPPEILELVDLSTLRPTRDNHVDERLKGVMSDLLFEAGVKGEKRVYVYVLFEHKSYDERYVLLQVLKAMAVIWGELRSPKKKGQGRGPGRDRGRPLPVIIPFVVYHGERRPKFPRKLRGLFGDRGELLRYVPEFGYELLDVRGLSDGEIRGQAETRAALLMMRHVFGKGLRRKLPGILRLADGLEDPDRRRSAIRQLLCYTAEAGRGVTQEEVERAVFEGLGRGGEDVMPTLAEKWYNDGMVKTAREFVLASVQARFGEAPEEIEAGLQRIESQDVLKRLHDVAVVADSLEAFRAALREVLASKGG